MLVGSDGVPFLHKLAASPKGCAGQGAGKGSFIIENPLMCCSRARALTLNAHQHGEDART